MKDNRIFITLDFDWASDEVLSYTLDLLSELSVPAATFFVTHDTAILQTIREQKFELGVHPNYLPALKGKLSNTPANEIASLREIVPEAVSVRTHGLVKANYLSDMYLQEGFTHEANTLLPITTGIPFLPYEMPQGLLQVGHCWGDSWQLAHCKWIAPEQIIQQQGVKVLLFHPIHLFLNSTDQEHYEKAKAFCGNYSALKGYVNTKIFGIRDFFTRFCEEISKCGFELDIVSAINTRSESEPD